MELDYPPIARHFSPLRLTILIVDDDPVILHLLTIILEDKALILTADAGLAGLQLAQQTVPDLVILDIFMDDLDGFELCGRLRQSPRTSHIPVIFISASDRASIERRSASFGRLDFLAKPLNPVLVRARVDTLLRRRRQQVHKEEADHLDRPTGAWNRGHFDITLAREVRRHARRNKPLALALINVDHFDIYKYQLGERQGDRCLAQIAHCLSTCFGRGTETVARYAVEEFAVIAPETAATHMLQQSEHVHRALRQLAMPHPVTPARTVTVSIGFASLQPDSDTMPGTLLGAADQALLRARASGRNRTVFLEHC